MKGPKRYRLITVETDERGRIFEVSRFSYTSLADVVRLAEQHELTPGAVLADGMTICEIVIESVGDEP